MKSNPGCVILGVGLISGTTLAQIEAPAIVHEDGLTGQTRPHSGYIDPRMESTNGIDLDLGPQEVRMRFNVEVFTCGGALADVGVDDFFIVETGDAEAPHVDEVAYIDGDKTYVRVHWDRPITLQVWTTIRAEVCNAEGVPIVNLGDLGSHDNEPDRVDLAFLPTDINNSGSVNPLDLLKFKQYVNLIATPRLGDMLDYVDVDRNGILTPIDLLRFKQGKNGVPPSTQAWKFEFIHTARP